MSKLVGLFKRSTSGAKLSPDVSLNLEIANLMSQSRRNCYEGIECFKILIAGSDLRSVTLTMHLLDTCIRNCSLDFHRAASSLGLIPVLVGLLKRRRKKLSVLEKLARLYKDAGWRKIEDQVLGFVQLWADTFMMHEDKYPAFMAYYRDLRKEGLRFPPRETIERLIIQFEADASPSFELPEFETHFHGHTALNSREVKCPSTPKVDFIPSAFQPTPCQQLHGSPPKMTSKDILTIRRYLPLLEELVGNAQTYAELRKGHVLYLYRMSRSIQIKLADVVTHRVNGVIGAAHTQDLLSSLDFVNMRMDNIRQAIYAIKSQGGGPHIKAMLQQSPTSQRIRLIDLDADFLSLPETSPLDKFDKFVPGEERKVLRSLSVPPTSADIAKEESPHRPTILSLQGSASIDLLEWDFSADFSPTSNSSLASIDFNSTPLNPSEEEDFFGALAARKIGSRMWMGPYSP